jgi:hypothetical protein
MRNVERELKAESSKQKTEGRSWNGEFGLRPVGAIRAYAPEGSGKAECGVRMI